jgi:ribulose-bisphosphate carboxylase large chain
MPIPAQLTVPHLSGERFRVLYRVQAADETAARQIGRGIALEQTVELPDELVPAGEIAAHIVGQIEDITPAAHPANPAVEGYDLTISYAVECAGTGLTQLLNVIFGNTSMQPGVQVRRLDLPGSITQQFKGPRFGIAGLRERLGVHNRPLLMTALKHMGLRPAALAEAAYAFALGGIDLIKDDHGLANQVFCPFEERAARCAEAVARANRETGRTCLYAPNITAPLDEIGKRGRYAQSVGAGALEISYGLTGYDAMRLLAEDDSLGLPIIAHPALSGSFVTSAHNGMAHRVTYGQLVRLAGGDISVFVSYGGRFPYTKEDCQGVIDGCTAPMSHLKPIMTAPGGGMTLARMPEMRGFYPFDTAFLVAGGLYAGDDLVANARAFAQAVSK